MVNLSIEPHYTERSGFFLMQTYKDHNKCFLFD